MRKLLLDIRCRVRSKHESSARRIPRQSRNGDDEQDAPYFFLRLYHEQCINRPRVGKQKTTK